MQKAKLVSQIAKFVNQKETDVLATIEAFMTIVKQELENGGRVDLRGFGNFFLKKMAEKTGRNISKGTTITIPAHYTPVFTPSKKQFKELVKNSNLVKNGN